jgi:hypothetical protein
MPGTQRDIPYLEDKFQTGDIPTQQDFYDLFASFMHYLKVKQEKGASTSDVMSQKILTDLLSERLFSTAFAAAVDLQDNFKVMHTITGAIEYTKGAQAHKIGNVREDFLVANGINKPTFSADFVVVWDNWVNTINTLNVIRFEYLSNGKIQVDLRYIE